MRARPGRDGRRWTRVEGFPPGPITSLPVVTGVEQSLVLMRTRRHSVTFRSRHNRSSMAAVHRSRSRRSRMPGLAWSSSASSGLTSRRSALRETRPRRTTSACRSSLSAELLTLTPPDATTPAVFNVPEGIGRQFDPRVRDLLHAHIPFALPGHCPHRLPFPVTAQPGPLLGREYPAAARSTHGHWPLEVRCSRAGSGGYNRGAQDAEMAELRLAAHTWPGQRSTGVSQRWMPGRGRGGGGIVVGAIAHLAAPVRVAAQVQHLGEPVGGHVGQAPDALARTAPPSTRYCDHALPPKTNEPGAQRRDHLSSVP